MPRARTGSATPATSGASGPTTTRSMSSDDARAATAAPSIGSTSCRVATAPMPGLPGAAWTSLTPGSRDRASASACSRPPEPITRVFTDDDPIGAGAPPRTRSCGWSVGSVVDDERLLATRADTDAPDLRARDRLERQDVALRVLRQLVERPATGDVLLPAVEELVDRQGVVELGLRH